MSNHSRYLDTRYFAALDGLRCLSIVPVIWHHATPYPLPGFLGKGPIGVDLFFCISGFLITTLLLREKAKSGQISLIDFYARRARRILPLYYLTLCGYLCFAWFMSEAQPARAYFFLTLPFYATFTVNWFADFAVAFPVLFAFAWSLCVEQQFYAVWPWLLKTLTRRGALLAVLALLGMDALAEQGGLPQLLAGGVGQRIVTSVAAPIGLGAIFALTLDSRRGFWLLSRVLAHKQSAPLALSGVIGLLVLDAPTPCLHLALAVLVGACVIQEQHGLTRMLQVAPVRHIGCVSYGLYLLHPSAIGVTRWLFPECSGSALTVFTLALLPAIGLATLSHRYFEAIFLRGGARFRVTAA